jgi:uncharacterized protein with HEPN domain
MNHNDIRLLGMLLRFCNKLQEIIALSGSLENFSADAKAKYAAHFKLLQISKMCEGLSPDFKEQYSEIPWARIRDFIWTSKSKSAEYIYKISQNEINNVIAFCNENLNVSR